MSTQIMLSDEEGKEQEWWTRLMGNVQLYKKIVKTVKPQLRSFRTSQTDKEVGIR